MKRSGSLQGENLSEVNSFALSCDEAVAKGNQTIRVIREDLNFRG
ncbi:MAG TPA: hypothetical protein VHA33_27900 [Candidatus Angelobacter sp.]|nr:hypothetical protein [Candidatus Angelobacter sp.]